MKVAPVSADLLIKLAIGAAAVGAAWYAWTKLRGAAGEAFGAVADTVGEVADAVAVGVNPINPENFINRGVSAAGGAIITSPTAPGKNADGSWTLGGAIYDMTHADAVTGKYWWQ